MKPLLLASSSPYRRQLLERLNIPFLSASPEIDESSLSDESPINLVTRLSLEKCLALASSYPDHLIIGSDQVAELNGAIITKPGNHHNAAAQLKAQSGQVVQFHTGLCLLDTASDRSEVDIVTTEVRFRDINDNEIERYLATEQPYDCAGSFMCEGLGISLFTAINTNDPTALIGLPLIRLGEMLRKQGLQVP
jgi:septum formation protein